MTQVFILTFWQACYECGGGTEIKGVFSTKESAEKFALDNFKPAKPWEIVNDYEITSFEINT